MKRIIVGTLDKIAVAAVILLLLAGLVIGWDAGEEVGAIGGLIVAFGVSVVIFGALFILLEMNASLLSILNILEKQAFPPKTGQRVATHTTPRAPALGERVDPSASDDERSSASAATVGADDGQLGVGSLTEARKIFTETFKPRR